MSRWKTNEIPTWLNIASETGCVNIERYSSSNAKFACSLGPQLWEKSRHGTICRARIAKPVGTRWSWRPPDPMSSIEDPGRPRKTQEDPFRLQKLCVVRSWKFAVQNCGAYRVILFRFQISGRLEWWELPEGSEILEQPGTTTWSLSNWSLKTGWVLTTRIFRITIGSTLW